MTEASDSLPTRPFVSHASSILPLPNHLVPPNMRGGSFLTSMSRAASSPPSPIHSSKTQLSVSFPSSPQTGQGAPCHPPTTNCTYFNHCPCPTSLELFVYFMIPFDVLEGKGWIFKFYTLDTENDNPGHCRHPLLECLSQSAVTSVSPISFSD